MQLALGVSLHDEATLDNFFIGSNHEVVFALRELIAAKGEPILYLWGPAGAGVSHLLQAACHKVFNAKGNAIYINLSEQQFTPDGLEDLESVDLICLDNIDSVMGDLQWEEALMHLYNRIRDSGVRLLFGAKALPRALPCQLLDLKSRLSWGLVLKLEELSFMALQEALQMRAVKRGLDLSTATCAYLCRYYKDDKTAVFNVLDQLDKASLLEKRKLTIPFVRKILNETNPEAY